MGAFTSFEQLEGWKACRVIVKWVKGAVVKLPPKRFDLKDNRTKAARSTTRNIAEEFGKFHYQENFQFCRISRGSLFEILDDVITMHKENYITEGDYKNGRQKISHAIKLVNGYIHYLQRQKDFSKT